MKERPILYSAPMVIARRDGRKTQTRRVIEPQPEWEFHGQPFVKCPDVGEKPQPIKCPYGKPGDILWTRENHRLMLANPAKRMVSVRYEADGLERNVILTPNEWQKIQARKQRVGMTYGAIIPGRFQYRSLARGLDEVVSVRVERLNDISEADAVAEGCSPAQGILGTDSFAIEQYRGEMGKWKMPLPVVRYAALWNSINGPGSWDANPWVWVVEFRKLKGGQP